MDCWGTIIDYHEPLRLSPERTSATGVETADLRDVDRVYSGLSQHVCVTSVFTYSVLFSKCCSSIVTIQSCIPSFDPACRDSCPWTVTLASLESTRRSAPVLVHTLYCHPPCRPARAPSAPAYPPQQHWRATTPCLDPRAQSRRSH